MEITNFYGKDYFQEMQTLTSFIALQNTFTLFAIKEGKTFS